MTKQYIKTLLLGCILVLCQLHSNATHIVGGDMSYKNIGPNQFEFTLNIYRDCHGIPVQPTYRLDYSSVTCNIQGNFVVTMDPSLTREVSAICPGIPTECVGGPQPGIQQYVYKAVFTLPQACTDWTFSWRECNRNAAITTIVNPDAQCIYIESTLNSVAAPDNNSPTFNEPPVSVLCIGQLNYYNPGTAEQDLDNLVFSAITPRTGKFKDVVYMPAYSAGSPLTNSSGYSVDAVNGNVVVNPTVVDEITVTALKVNEFRNGVLIGSTMRDIQIITKDCNNNNPILSGIDKSLSDSISVCAGKQICFSVFGSDIDIGQNLSMTWNYGIDTSRAKFDVTGDSIAPKGSFCWNTRASDAGLHFFTVTVKDDFCPILGSTTRAYKIRVIPSPTITLQNPIDIPCNTTTLISPTITGGSGTYAYKWNTGATTKDITVGSGAYTLFVTDNRGCRSSAATEVRTGLVANFTIAKVCSTRTVAFTDSSVSLVGNVVTWSWNFGEPSSGASNTSTLEDPVHVYAAGGIYDVVLTVTDNSGCVETITKKVRVCDFPVANFITRDSCQNKFYTYIQDKSTATICGIKSIVYSFGVLAGGYFSPPYPIYYPPNYTFGVVQPDTGMINLTYTITNEDGCTSTVSKMVHINPQPLINVVESNFYFDCSNPTTTLHAQLLPSYGKPPFIITWNTGDVGPTTEINAPGVYVATVIDANGCVHSDLVDVLDPLEPAFYNDPYCELTDQVKFHDDTQSHWGAVRWDWNFGDGTTFSTTNPLFKHPTHVYSAEGIYRVKLTVYDAKGCQDTAVQNFIFILPDNHFVVEPSPFCVGQELTFESPRGLYVDSLIWNFELDTMYLGRPNFQFYPPNATPPLTPDYYYFNGKYTYPGSSAGQTYDVRLTMKYNNNQCVRNYSKTISIFPAFDVEIDSMRGNQCAGDTLSFYASEKTGTAVSWKWNFDLQSNVPPYNLIPQDSSTLQNPKVTFSKNGNYYARLVATNTDGCQEVIRGYGFSVVALPRPEFCTENPCVSQHIKFFYFCSNFPEVNIDSVHWDFGDGAGIDVQEPFHIYADSGLYNVTCEIFNTAFGCHNDTTIPTRIYLLPVPDFTADPVCLGQNMHFTDLSQPSPGDTLERWSWSFGDGGVFSTTSPSFSSPDHLYANTGTYQVSLIVENTVEGDKFCADTVTKPVSVFPNPEAAFTFDENDLVGGVPIRFIDHSTGGVRWLWNFGDGTSVTITDSLNRNPEHNFPEDLDQVTIEQIVYNQFECTDTFRVTIKLGIHLVLPNAFSPNGDGNNDGFRPVYKGISELIDFSVFNRWGEKIFDGGNDLKAIWDGTYKGKEQPLGEYVYYVKAKTKQGKEIAQSGNVTLVR